MKKILTLLLCSCMLLTACSKKKELNKYTTTLLDVGFDTFVQFTAYTEDEDTFKSYGLDLQEQFKHYNALFDKYNTYEGVNNIKTINDNAGIEAVKVEDDLMEMLVLAKQYSTYSSSHFDITMGSVLEIWHNYREDAETNPPAIPSMEELTAAKTNSGWEFVEINEAEQSVYITNKEVSLDVGAIAKGFACEKVAQDLQKDGLTSGIINAGGNVRLIGDKPNGSLWEVGIQIPDASLSDSLIRVKMSKDMSFVTSGDYQRFYMYENQMMHHIIDPTTLFPSRHARSVTVITADSGIADMLSTTLFTMSYEDGNKLLETLRENGIEVEAIWLFDETNDLPEDIKLTRQGYSIQYTDGLEYAIVK